MKKFLVIALTVYVLLILAACGGNGNNDPYIPMFHRFWSVINVENEGTTEEVRAIFENFGVVVLDIEVDDFDMQSIFIVEFEFNPGELEIVDYLENLEHVLYVNGYEPW